MDYLKYAEPYWPAFSTNPVSHLVAAGLGAAVAWLVLLFLYKERIETLKSRLEAEKDRLARADAASAEKDALIAELKKSKTKDEEAPEPRDGRMSKGQAARFAQVIRSRGGSVKIVRGDSAMGGAAAAQLEALFRENGWTVSTSLFWGESPSASQFPAILYMPVSPYQGGAELIATALMEAKVHFSVEGPYESRSEEPVLRLRGPIFAPDYDQVARTIGSR